MPDHFHDLEDPPDDRQGVGDHKEPPAAAEDLRQTLDLPHGGHVEMGMRLQRARQAAGLSRGALARTLRISEESLRSYETGRRTLPADLLPALGVTLDVDVAWLVGVPGASRESVASTLATIAQLLGRVEERVSALRRLLEALGRRTSMTEPRRRWNAPPEP